MNGISNPIYSRRKRFLPEYRELFAALLNIPDEDVRNRVMDAINGMQKCSVCKRSNIELSDIGTQTEDCKVDSMQVFKQYNETLPNVASFEKKRRKRKRNCPKVVKTAQHSGVAPVLQQEVVHTIDTASVPAKVVRKNSWNSASSAEFEIDSAIMNEIILDSPRIAPQYTQHDELLKLMQIELETREKFDSDGLLPIHQAIDKNDINQLTRQIHVWNFFKINLMELLTEDGYNPLQLAVQNNCYTCIINRLLKENIHLSDIDDEGNTIIHLAVLNLSPEVPPTQLKILKTLELLVEKIDLPLLCEHNDVGMTALHEAVKKNKYLMVETILNVVDKRLNLESVIPLNDPLADEKKFSLHYLKQCENFDGRKQNELKNKILNAKDMKAGFTALFFAIELKHEHIVYLLLAHLSNPCVENLSGLDAKTFYTDHGKNHNILTSIEKLSLFHCSK